MNLDSMTIKNLRNFVKVVDCNGISKASEMSNLTKSTMYGHLKWLEAKTGCTFFYEIINRRNLTPEGMKMYEYANKILNIIDHDIANINSKR